MRTIKLGFGGVALEPEASGKDNVARLDVSSLRGVGISESAIQIYQRFVAESKLSPDDGTGPETDHAPSKSAGR